MGNSVYMYSNDYLLFVQLAPLAFTHKVTSINHSEHFLRWHIYMYAYATEYTKDKEGVYC